MSINQIINKNIMVSPQRNVAKKYIPKDMHSNVKILLNKMLREEAIHTERNGQYKTTIISSLEIGDSVKFSTNRIATPNIISKENIPKGTSTLRMNNIEFNIDNASGKISTESKESKEVIKDFLNKGNQILKSAIENFNSDNIKKK